ncbi:MAG: hypothetical protein GIW99_03695 [Candidatus Eremiobacteraeota bacterium]|nr:hypothetical protein [Candidatus Eremiobacteraeota bacterium]MBC5826776.1 hypothetical protein [Candidatus Eremiobacteraeota bacterium]
MTVEPSGPASEASSAEALVSGTLDGGAVSGGLYDHAHLRQADSIILSRAAERLLRAGLRLRAYIDSALLELHRRIRSSAGSILLEGGVYRAV